MCGAHHERRRRQRQLLRVPQTVMPYWIAAGASVHHARRYRPASVRTAAVLLSLLPSGSAARAATEAPSSQLQQSLLWGSSLLSECCCAVRRELAGLEAKTKGHREGK